MKVAAKKSLGQNFLINQGILDAIIEIGQVEEGDTVLEIGPGTGNLTHKLAEKSKRVIAIEKDHRLIEPLREELPNNTEVIEGDVLVFRPGDIGLAPGQYKVIANIPYYLTSHLLRVVFESWPQPQLLVLMVQKEVAQRITAQPPAMNLLALSVQYFAQAHLEKTVSAGSFRPMPKVDSAIIKLIPHDSIPPQEETDFFFKVVHAGFASKRKQLLGNLRDHLGLSKEELQTVFEHIGLEATIRAENLSIILWKTLSSVLAPLTGNSLRT